MEGTWRLH